MRYTFILNPAAGHGAAGRKRRAVEAAVAASGLDAELQTTAGPGHAVELAHAAAQAGHAVVAVGGDGTVQEVSTGVIASGHAVPFGVVPLGTGNDFVKMVGMPRTPQAAVAALQQATPQRVDYGRVRWWDESGPGTATFLNAVGIGFDARVADAVAAYKFLPGVASYLAAVFKTLRLWQTPAVRVRVEQNGTAHTYEGSLLLTTAGNGTCSGGGFYLTPDASISDGVFDVCVIEGISTARIFQLIPLALFGKHTGAGEVHMHRAEHVSVESDLPLPVHVDGELVTRGTRRLEVEIVPGGLTVLMPNGKAR